MATRLKNPVTASSLAKLVGGSLVGPDREISFICSLDQMAGNCIAFSKLPLLAPPPAGATVFVPLGETNHGSAALIPVANPRMAFATALQWLSKISGFERPSQAAQIHPSAIVGQHCVFGQGVQIGPDCVIGNHVTLGDSVIIGARTVIKSCAVIGEDGFGFERDDQGLPVRLIHLGGVRIGNDAEVGSFTTVCRGTLGDTIIEDHAKVDDHVHVSHNVRIRRAAMVIACAELSGGVEVGEFAWVGPNASVIQKVKIGTRATVGIGANVLKHVAENTVVAGNPAKPLISRAT